MKILVWTDPHLGLVLAGYDAHTDIVRAAQVVVDATDEVDLVVLAGDLFHDSRPKPREVAAAIELLGAIYKPLIVIPGNHDAGQGRILIETDSGLSSIPAPDALEPIRKLQFTQDYVRIPDRPCIEEYGDHRFLLAGHISDAMARHIAGCSAQELIDHAFEDALRSGVSAVFSHLDFEGSHPGSEEQIRRGGRLTMPLDIVRRLSAPVVNGHLHAQQFIPPNIYMPGSIVSTDFGDIDGLKQYMLLEI